MSQFLRREETGVPGGNPPSQVEICALKCKRDFTLPKCKTESLKKSFILTHVYDM